MMMHSNRKNGSNNALNKSNDSQMSCVAGNMISNGENDLKHDETPTESTPVKINIEINNENNLNVNQKLNFDDPKSHQEKMNFDVKVRSKSTDDISESYKANNGSCLRKLSEHFKSLDLETYHLGKPDTVVFTEKTSRINNQPQPRDFSNEKVKSQEIKANTEGNEDYVVINLNEG
jgi:hypothetical protein